MSNPSIRERLALDHFYIPATSEELTSLSKMTSKLRDSVHSRVVSGDDHWEGIYISGRMGDYFEIVRYPRASDLGLAFSNAWVMHYHFTHWPQAKMPSGPRVIDRFTRIELTVGRTRVPALRALIPWLPGSQTWSDARALLHLPLRDGHKFEVDISIINGCAPLSFCSLEMEITRGQDVEPGEFGRFSLSKTDEHTIVFRKNSKSAAC